MDVRDWSGGSFDDDFGYSDFDEFMPVRLMKRKKIKTPKFNETSKKTEIEVDEYLDDEEV